MIDTTKLQGVLQSPKTRKYGRWLLVAFIVLGIVGFLVLPPIVKHVAVGQLSELLHRPVAVRSVSINPYTLALTVEGVEVKEREGDALFAGFEKLYVNLQLSSLFRLGPVVREIQLVAPKFHVVREAENRYNFSDLIDEFMSKPKDDGPTPAFSLNNIQISGGSLEFDDRLVGETHVINDIDLALPFVSSMSYATDIFVEPHFSANFDGSPIDVKGRSKPFSTTRESEFVLALDGMQLPKYFDYLPVKLPVKLASGTLDTDLTVTFAQDATQGMRLQVSGTTAISDFRMTESSGALLAAVKRLDVALGASDILGGKFVVDRVAVEAPEVGVRATRAGSLNWLDFLPKPDKRGENAAAKGKDAGDKEKSTLEWSLGEASIHAGAVHWLDESNPGAYRADVTAIDASLKKLDNRGSVADFALSWKIDGGELLKVDSLSVRDGKLDLAKQHVRIGDARLTGAKLAMRRLADGGLDWIKPPALRLAEAAKKEENGAWKVDVDNYVGEGIALRFEDAAVTPKATQDIEDLGFELANLSTEPGKTANVKAAFRLNRKGTIAVGGKVTALPKLDAALNVDLKGVELLPLQPYFTEKLNIDITRGQVSVKGDVALKQGKTAAAKADSKADAADAWSGGFTGQATVGDFQSVDKLNSADLLRWKSFHLGRVDVRFGPEAVSVGDVALSDFFARVIVNPEGKLNLLQIVRTPEAADGKPAGAAPANASTPGASAPAAAMTKAEKTATTSGDGTASVPLAGEKKQVIPIKIEKITLQGGNVRFTDNFVKPNYTANLREIGGRVTGLSSEAGSQADVELRGSYDNVAPLTIAAKINPLSAKPYLDLQADVKGIELTSMSTYSGKYAGYAIDKGKLSVFVKYKIENDQLEAENRVFLDQLTFGDAVDSPDATKLPVRLAVSLLKNRNGEIDINLPISGSLNDPQFSVGGLIVKVVVNLLVKAATSPFALIGSMFGSGEELSSVEFDPGRAALTAEATKRLENLSKALVDRPALRLEIEGRADPEQDTEGLKRARLERQVRAVKRGDMTRANRESGEAETLEVSAQEYPALLERVYKDAKFPKPRNMIGLVKGLPVEEMEKLILANSTVDDEDMKDLAERRAKNVRDWLVEHEVPVERVFLLPAKLGAATGAGEAGGKTGRSANFSLR